jgi:two-component system sensor kinase FixL
MVQKPFSADGILTAVNRLLETSAQLEAGDRGRSSSWRDVDVLKELFEDGPGFMAVGLGQEPRFTFANKAYRQLVGNRPLIGLTVAEALPEVAAQGILDILARVQKSGEPFVAYGMPISLAVTGGRTEQKFVDVIFHALSNEAGATIGLAAQGRDVTQQRETERRLGALRSAIIENARIKTMDALASAIAHELNQPLTAISNDMWTAQQLLKKHEGDPGLAACLLRAEASAARAGKIIRKLRQMASKGPPETERFDLRSISVDAIELGTTGINKVFVNYHDHPDMEVIGDPVQIQQVLINLVRNACDAIEDQGSIDVIASRIRGFVSICVNDSGPGIPGDILPVIFDAFATTKAKGMGIGLSISKEIVEAHGGRISAQNLPSGGASICFTVPLALEMYE